MPESILKAIMIPRQAASEAEAEAVDSAAAASGSTSSTTMITGFVASIVTTGLLKYVWSMLDNLQIVTHLSLIKTKSPANANQFNQVFLEASSF